ncbi:hypothetical protein EV06_1228 [Prochlorococcus sp. MIT 0602]|nr:hypothetical protein EV06_1228 [Prochlorococcus sp. MIT 0602]
MQNKRKVIGSLLLLMIVAAFLSLIGAIIKLINLQTIILSIILLTILTKKNLRTLIQRILRKLIFSIRTDNITKNLPKDRSDAAIKSLDSIDQLTQLIQDKIASEGLRHEKKRVEKMLLRGDLVVVVFGTGSSGKTSLISALLNRIVGEIDPSMGSTKRTGSYRLHLKGLTRGIKIIDTPGILEGGEDGRLREQEALLKASRADLIIFVVDSDLRAFEMKVITNLSKVGKRLIIALNKCDLLSEREEMKLISLIRNHCNGLIEPHDITTISASPQSIPNTGSRPLQPKPEINQLIKRISFVLHSEGEELIADNILLQCRNLGESGRKLLNRQRFIESNRCVDKYSWISSGVVLITPLPGVDLIATAVVNSRMVMEIARIYGVELKKDGAKNLAISVSQTIAGLGIVKGGVSLISNSLTLHLPTYLIGKTIQSITASWLTKVAGESFVTYFQQNQNWGDGGIQEVVQYHYDLNRRETNLREFIRIAIDRVVQPVDMNKKKKQLPPYSRLQEEEGA